MPESIFSEDVAIACSWSNEGINLNLESSDLVSYLKSVKKYFLNSRVKEGVTLTYTLEILEETTLRPQKFEELSTSIAQPCRSSWGPSGPKIPSGPTGVENGCISLQENAQWWRNMLSLHKECSQIAKPCMSTSQRYSLDPIL
jgi:hypothetical protein